MRMPRWKWALLVTELVLFALILILPQVALPDFTFHGGTAPVLVKQRLAGRFGMYAVPPLAAFVATRQLIDRRVDRNVVRTADSAQARLALFCVLIC